MLTKLHPLQVENQLENNNTVWRMGRRNTSEEAVFYILLLRWKRTFPLEKVRLILINFCKN